MAEVLSPGISQSLHDVAQLVMQGRMSEINRDQFVVRRHTYFHQIAFAGAQTMQLFNVNYDPFVCNLPNPQQFAQEELFLLQAPRVVLPKGIDANSALAASLNSVFEADASVTTAVALQRSIESVMYAGTWNLNIGKRQLLKDQPGLLRYPAGQGIDGFGWGMTTTASRTIGGQVQNNGAPVVGNAFPAEPYLVLGNERIDSQLTFKSAIAPASTFPIRFELEGIVITPATR